MKKRAWVLIAIAVMLIVGLVAVPLTASARECDPIPAAPIPPGQLDFLIQPWERYIGAPATPNPVPHVEIPQHDSMAPNGVSNMHNDGYMTDTYEVSGPLGLDPQISSTLRKGKLVVTVTFDKHGRMVAVAAGALGPPQLLLLDPDTLDELAFYDLPDRPYPWWQDAIPLSEDPSGGVYFYLDDDDNVIVTTHDYKLLVIELPPLGNPCFGFQVVQEYDLSDHVLDLDNDTPPVRDKLGPALPDWGGEYYWYSTRYGLVGVVNRDTGEINNVLLADEQIQNSPAVGKDGFYVISDCAMYRFTVDKKTGNPVMEWRTEYDRGTEQKPGMILQGSGTTPNLFGDLVAIADNADPMNVLFLRRDTGEVVASVAVFEKGESGTECALIGVQHPDGTYSVIVENNYGYVNYLDTLGGKTTVGGVTRIDVVLDETSETGYSGSIAWTSDEISCTPVPKLSLANGLVYLYTKPPNYYPPGLPPLHLVDKWYFTAVDFETGETVYSVLTGEGPFYNNNWGVITLGPDGGTAYIGALGGLIKIQDSAP